MDTIERVARVLAGRHFSRNADGEIEPGEAAADEVDEAWLDFEEDAVAVLKTLREPPDGVDDTLKEQHWRECVIVALGVYGRP